MVGEADVAVLAFGYPAAGVALYHGGETAAVLKEDDLFFLFQRGKEAPVIFPQHQFPTRREKNGY